MTLPATTTRRSPRRRKAPPAAPVVTRLLKPVTVDDVARLHDLAVKLAGRPVPGVRMTEKEFEHWCDEDVKAEWVGGEVILMSPEAFDQVTLAGWLYRLLSEFVEYHDLGEVIGRDFIVRLPRQRRRRAPDLLFIARARLQLLRPTYFEGAPDLIVEIVSPDSQSRDWRVKFREYERAGVQEYWLFDPRSKAAEAYALGKDKRYQPIAETDGRLASDVIPASTSGPNGFAWKNCRASCLS